VFFSVAIFVNSTEIGPFYSQYEQDQFVYNNFFRDKRDGIFVDIGAHNGVTINNTKFFEDSLNWTGVCIEPIPDIFEQLQRNRKAICIQGCIAKQEGTAQFIKFSGGYYGEMFSGLSDSYAVSSFEYFKKEGLQYEIIDVRCYLLNNILEKNGIYHIDYLSIDTEGAELDILKSIDFKKFDIDVIGVENNTNTPKIARFLAYKGYAFQMHVGVDDIFKKNPSFR
jgi:FkbM family methyltransferase